MIFHLFIDSFTVFYRQLAPLLLALVRTTLFGAKTGIQRKIMDEVGDVQNLQGSRAGYRAHLTKTLKKAAELMAKETPNEMEIVSANNILEQLMRKKTKLKECRN